MTAALQSSWKRICAALTFVDDDDDDDDDGILISNQSVCIKWKCDFSAKFGIGNGT